MKYLITFEKGESARWLGHLDILRTFERAIRRAELPIVFSTGFNPRERITFASALSVGVTGEAELATLELTEAVAPDQLAARLNAKLPPGIRLRTVEEIPDAGSRDLLNRFRLAELRVTCACPSGVTLQAAQRAVDALLQRDRLLIEREREGRTRQIDLRPFLHSIRVDDVSGDRLTLTMLISLGAEGSARPAEVVALLAEMLPGLAVRRVHRVRLLQAA